MRKNKTSKVSFVCIGIIFLILSVAMFLFVTVEANKTPANAEGVYTETPCITVLTHGLGGSPKDWSNNSYFFSDEYSGYQETVHYKKRAFEYRGASIIEQLRQKNPNSVVYVVSANNDSIENSGNPFIDKFTPDTDSPTGYSAQAVSVNDMDFSKHSIIVYNASSTWKEFVCYNGPENEVDNIDLTQDSVVEDFFKSIDYIVNAYKNANNQIYPKMNLIGHSQGTIVNLLYATKIRI